MTGLETQRPNNPHREKYCHRIHRNPDKRTIGRMVKDIIAVKRRFTLTYQGLTSEHALIFLNAYRSGRPVTFEYIDIQGVQTARVYIMSLPREIFTPRPRYTQNVTITMEEE